MPSSRKVVLNNGAEERLGKAEKIFMRLKALDHIAFKELLTKCKDSNHEIFGKAGEILQGLNLLEKNGSVSDAIRNIVLSSVQEEGERLALIDPIRKTAVKEIKDILEEPHSETHKHSAEKIPSLEEIQRNLFKGLNNEEKKTDRERRFEGFIEFRKIKEEDYPIIAELYTYPNGEFVGWFHNAINFQRERFGEDLQRSIPSYTRERPELKRFFELFLLFFEKYDWIATNNLNSIMEEKKEFKMGLQ